MPPRYKNLDDNESIYFSRELEYMKTQSYDIKFPQFKARQFFPATSEAGPTAETVVYRQYEPFGIAKLLHHYSDDLPSVSIAAREFTSRVKPCGAEFHYSIQDVRRSAKENKRLTQREAKAALRSHEERWEKIAWYGDTTFGIQGFLYDGNITKTVPTSGAGATDKWIDKTALEILADLNKIVTDIIELTKGVEVPTDIILPIAQYNRLFQTKLDTGSDTTIAQFFLANNPSIQRIEWADQLKAVDPLPSGPAGPLDLMVCYKRDPDYVQFHIPQPYEQFEPQSRGLVYVVPTHSRVGGVVNYYPLSASIMEGI